MSLRRLPMCADLINSDYNNFTLLDIGCRTMALKPLLKGCIEYTGTDLTAGDGVIACDLEKGLPDFKDNSYDIVTALDVLEHLENCHFVLEEMIRVARKGVFVSLPNMFYIKFRLNFLLGRGLSGKYSFPEHRILDRHRWVLSFTEAERFLKANAGAHHLQVYKIVPERGRTKNIIEPLQTKLAEKLPDLLAYGSLFYLKLNK